MQKRKFIFTALLFLLIPSLLAYSCDGDKIDWDIKENVGILECETASSCASIFNKVSSSVLNGEINIVKCPLKSTYSYGKDIILNQTFYTVNQTQYTLTYTWQAQIVDKNCANTLGSVYCVQISNVTFDGNISHIDVECGDCEGNLCGEQRTTDFITETITFTASTNKTMITFRTYGGNGVVLKIKDISISELPCQHMCGGSPTCDYNLPETYLQTCENGVTYFQDYCDEECNLVDEEDTCKAPSFKLSCTADFRCDDIAPDSMMDENSYCSSECLYKTLDDDETKCEEAGYSWISGACCGNNANEYLSSCMTEDGVCEGQKCCESESCVYNNVCYPIGSYAPLEECGTGFYCNSNLILQAVKTQGLCSSCGVWTGEDCCYGIKNYDYIGGACLNGIDYNCGADGKCSQKFGVSCATNDPDCQNIEVAFDPVGVAEKKDGFFNVEFSIFYLGNENSASAEFSIIKDDEIIYSETKTIQISNTYEKHTLSINLPQNIEGGFYKLVKKIITADETAEHEETIRVNDNCVKIELPSTVEIINSSFAARLKNDCSYAINNLNWTFMDKSGSVEYIEFYSTITITNLEMNITESDFLSISYEKGSLSKYITLIAGDVEMALNNAINKIISVNEKYNSVSSKLVFGVFMDKTSTFELLSQSTSLINNANSEKNNGNYILAKYYAESAEQIIDAIDNEVNLNIITLLFAGAIFMGGVAGVFLIANKEKIFKPKQAPKQVPSQAQKPQAKTQQQKK
ncbi:MAG: hypothetical protein PHW96_04190 [Candidatus Nanoarchaeia archaeon]|nr:hypothetical protein [Candidatus Nanoarchaeia archaeon]